MAIEFGKLALRYIGVHVEPIFQRGKKIVAGILYGLGAGPETRQPLDVRVPVPIVQPLILGVTHCRMKVFRQRCHASSVAAGIL